MTRTSSGPPFQQGRDERSRVGAVPVDQRQRGMQSLRAGPRGIARDGIEAAHGPPPERAELADDRRHMGDLGGPEPLDQRPGLEGPVAPRRARDEQGGDEQGPRAPGEMMPRRGGHHGAFALAPTRRPGIHRDRQPFPERRELPCFAPIVPELGPLGQPQLRPPPPTLLLLDGQPFAQRRHEVIVRELVMLKDEG